MAIEMLVRITEYHIGPVDGEYAKGDNGEKDIQSVRSSVKGTGGSGNKSNVLFVEDLCHSPEKGNLSLLMIVIVHGQVIEDEQTQDHGWNSKKPQGPIQ